MSPRTGPPSYTRNRATGGRPAKGQLALILLLPVVLAGLIGAAIGYAVAAPDETAAAVDRIRAEEARRDVTQITELTAQARTTAAELEVLLGELDAALADGAPPAAADQVARWQATMRAAVERHADTPSGTTATNVARGALRGAVDGFAAAVDLYAAALGLPDADRPPVLALVDRQRTGAATAWSVAAAQLDQINIDAGNGHQHVYLGGHAGEGAFTPDGAPEGEPGG
ncbi:hypothetical protein [Polymorphospora rubra]|uniref:Uncharacterized protein n=1 Tax=Polymorphospora rubra TaxID=338584 RepID=A0A810N7T8_9ACTN|nr:hypothetical protein [Polymorphospora rubra]BCJ67693.1 hypothetical protein Prubr_47140 [Polymorphospora rubra]